MKKLTIALIALMVVMSCNKKKNSVVQTTQNSPKNVTSLIAKINSIGNSYKNKSTTGSAAHKTTRSSWGSWFADAISGAIAGGPGTPPCISCAITVGSAVSAAFASASVANIPNPLNPGPNTTGSGSFIYGVAGDDHNTILYDLYSNGVTISLDANGNFNQATVNLYSNLSFLNINNGNDNMAAIFQNEAPLTTSMVQYTNNTYSNPNYASDFLSHYSSDLNLNLVIESIISNVQNDIANESDCTSYLLQVQTTIQQSQDLTPAQQQEICVFLAIANSSIYFWDANGYSAF